jgi:hypothetical protein
MGTKIKAISEGSVRPEAEWSHPEKPRHKRMRRFRAVTFRVIASLFIWKLYVLALTTHSDAARQAPGFVIVLILASPRILLGVLVMWCFGILGRYID